MRRFVDVYASHGPWALHCVFPFRSLHEHAYCLLCRTRMRCHSLIFTRWSCRPPRPPTSLVTATIIVSETCLFCVPVHFHIFFLTSPCSSTWVLLATKLVLDSFPGLQLDCWSSCFLSLLLGSAYSFVGQAQHHLFKQVRPLYYCQMPSLTCFLSATFCGIKPGKKQVSLKLQLASALDSTANCFS